MEGRDVKASGSDFGDGNGDDVGSGLAVEAGWVGSFTEVSTRLYTLDSKVYIFLKL